MLNLIFISTTIILDVVFGQSSLEKKFTPCEGKPADVVFALDTSNSIWPGDFVKQLAFVKDVTGVFMIGRDNTQVGAFTYADRVKLQFDLYRYHNSDDLEKAIQVIRQDGGYVTRTADAIRYMRENSFRESAGARKNVTKVGIVITDGLSYNTTETGIEADKNREAGIHMFSVGVGRRTDLRELTIIANQPSSYFMFQVDSFNRLGSIKDLLAIKACQVTDPPTTPIPTPPNRQDVKFDTGGGPFDPSSGEHLYAMGARDPSRAPEGAHQLSEVGLGARLWRFNPEGRLSEVGRDVTQNDGVYLSRLARATDAYVDDGIIWGLDQEQRRIKIGCVFNGTHYIGYWVKDDEGKDMWYGFPVDRLPGSTSGAGNDRNRAGPGRDGHWIDGASRLGPDERDRDRNRERERYRNAEGERDEYGRLIREQVNSGDERQPYPDLSKGRGNQRQPQPDWSIDRNGERNAYPGRATHLDSRYNGGSDRSTNEDPTYNGNVDMSKNIDQKYYDNPKRLTNDRNGRRDGYQNERDNEGRGIASENGRNTRPDWSERLDDRGRGRDRNSDWSNSNSNRDGNGENSPYNSRPLDDSDRRRRPDGQTDREINGRDNLGRENGGRENQDRPIYSNRDDRNTDPNRLGSADRGGRTRILEQRPDSSNLGQDQRKPEGEGHSKVGQPMVDSQGQPGVWNRTENGKQVWMEYVCPGVYKPVDKPPESATSSEGSRHDIHQLSGKNVTYLYPEQSGRPVTSLNDVTECVVTEDDGKQSVYRYIGPGRFRKIGQTGEGIRRPVESQGPVRINGEDGNMALTLGQAVPYMNGDRGRIGKAGCVPPHPLDLIFILDSRTQPQRQAASLWRVVRDVIALVDTVDQWVRVRFVQDWQRDSYDSLARGPFVNKDDLLRAVQSALDHVPMTSAELIGSMTSMFAQNEGKAGMGGRAAVFVSDGEVVEPEMAQREVERARELFGVNLISVGVGPKAQDEALRSLVSEPKADNYLAVNHQSKHRTVAQVIANKLCNVV